MRKKAIKILILFIVLVMAVGTSACGKTQKSEAADRVKVDEDLTEMSATVIYSKVYDMLVNGSDYQGKTIRMQGLFSSYYDEVEADTRYGCIIQDATACCAQGLEFILSEDLDKYPKEGDEITVVGTFELVDDGKYLTAVIKDAVME